MSTVEEKAASGMTADVPLLRDGQRLDGAEFLRRYEQTPPGFKAELIGGVVHVPSPLSVPHGRSLVDTSTWLGLYDARTPGVEARGEATTVLDELGVPQPDNQLRILPESDGQTHNEGEYVGGAPELVVEVAKSSKRIDVGEKRADYERAGVLVYVVVTLDPGEVHWHVRRGGRLERIPRDPDGIYRTDVFPGLWLDPAALLRGDLAGVIAILERGLASPEHAAFVARLAAEAARSAGGV